MSSKNSPICTNRPLRTGYTVALVLVVLFGGLATMPIAGQAATPDPNDVLDDRERALDKLATLESFERSSAVGIDDGVLRSIRDAIESGNISYRDNNFSAAASHYQTAIEQANAALETVYLTRSSILLNESQLHLSKLEENGYDKMNVSALQAQAFQYEKRLETVSSYREAKDLHQNVVTFDTRVADLPDTDFVGFVQGYYTNVIPVQVILMLFAGGVGAAAMRYRIDIPEEEDEDTGDDEETENKTITPSTLGTDD